MPIPLVPVLIGATVAAFALFANKSGSSSSNTGGSGNTNKPPPSGNPPQTVPPKNDPPQIIATGPLPGVESSPNHFWNYDIEAGDTGMDAIATKFTGSASRAKLDAMIKANPTRQTSYSWVKNNPSDAGPMYPLTSTNTPPDYDSTARQGEKVSYTPTGKVFSSFVVGDTILLPKEWNTFIAEDASRSPGVALAHDPRRPGYDYVSPGQKV